MTHSLDHFERLDKYGNQRRDPANPEHVAAYDALKSDYNATRDWAVAVQQKLFPHGRIDVRRSPIDRAQTFHPYTWAKIYPDRASPKDLAYTVGTGSEDGFIVKLDVTFEGTLRERFRKDFQKSFSNDSAIVAMLPAEQGCKLTMEELVDWSIAKIKSFGMTYEEVAKGLGISLVGNASLAPVDVVGEGADVDTEEITPTAVNRILYGPPGTGKTWSTMIHAVALADNLRLEDVTKWDRDDQLRPRWDELVEEGRIRFVTFHPAMTYEDFVEGLKPKLEENVVSYAFEAGVFKELSQKALEAWNKARPQGVELTPEMEFQETMKSLADSRMRLGTKEGAFFTVTRGARGGWQAVPESTGKFISITLKNLNKLLQGQKLNQRLPYLRGILEHLGKSIPDSDSCTAPGFVLVIDEINRGNIPAIFGELITLLEPDKRVGCDEELFVTLPGTKKEFGVPPNLHVLGTMNTADRSVEALDTALRRRFEFVEMMPRYDINEINREVDGVNLGEILRTINQRLEALIDRDHTIGHAFFINVKTLDDLKAAFANKIIPLLQEFFYGEWNKIGLVLGEEFVRKPKGAMVKFAKGFDEESVDADVPYAMVPSGEWTAESFKKILAE